MKVFLSVLCFVISTVTLGQNVEVLNGFKYLHVNQMQYNGQDADPYSLRPMVYSTFEKLGFKIIDLDNYSDPTQIPPYLLENPCQILTCSIWHSQPRYPIGGTDVILRFTDCYGDIVYRVEVSGLPHIDPGSNVRRGMKKALRSFKKFKYEFNADLTPEISIELETTDYTLESFEDALLSRVVDSYEGIYKNTVSEGFSYTLGVEKDGSSFNFIVLSTTNAAWSVGEIKGNAQIIDNEGTFSIEFYNDFKEKVETFGRFAPEGIGFIVETMNEGEKENLEFIKVFPKRDEIDGLPSGVATGSGFLISSSGYVATNYHVIDGANEISIHFNGSDSRPSFSAEVVLVDEEHDIAVLRLLEEDYSAEVPYTFAEDVRVGEDVFTVGFPMSFVMGENFKVTSGIISANSGVADDEAYLQITVPIQPGNSGGPLINENGQIIGITTASLNDDAVRADIENVNYAVKIEYLFNLIKVMPAIKVNENNTLAGIDRPDMIEKIRNCIVLIEASSN